MICLLWQDRQDHLAMPWNSLAVFPRSPVTFQGGTEVTTGAAELGAVGRAEEQCPVQDQDVYKEMSCPCTWDTLWTHRDTEEEVLLQGSVGYRATRSTP